VVGGEEGGRVDVADGLGVGASGRGQVVPDRGGGRGLGRRLGALLDEHADDGEQAGGVPVDEVDLERVTLTLDGVLARAVEMILHELEGLIAGLEGAAGLVFDLDGVTGVLDAQRVGAVVEAELVGAALGDRVEVDRRL